MSSGRPDVRRYATYDELSRAAADDVCAVAEAAVTQRGVCHVALAGGHTPVGLYQALSATPHRDRVPWARVHLFFGDERAVFPTDAASNYRMAEECLLRRVPIPADQVHRIEAEAPDRDAAAARYAAIVSARVPPAATSGPPAFDLFLLGLGSDGHTASLFPGSPALAETARWFVPSTSPATPHARVTATLPLINAARTVMFLVSGAGKAAALAAVLDPIAGADPVPARLVMPRGRLLWFVDRAACPEGVSG